MTANLCVVCGRPTPDGWACAPCAGARAARLQAITDTTPAARDVAHRLTRRGGIGAAGKPGSTLPFDLGATARLDAVQGALTTLARDIAETRGLQIAVAVSDGRGVPDPLVTAATWLQGHLEWVRHAVDGGQEPYAARVFDEIDRCARVIAGIARGPASQKYLGPCCVVLETERDGELVAEECDGDVYAHIGARHGVCRTCGISHDVAERQAWLDEEVRSRAFTSSEIEDAYGEYGLRAGTIRQWASRGIINAHGHNLRGHPMYLLGEVLEVARNNALKRAEREVKRTRRVA